MAEQKRDYYEVLGIGKNADDAEIKKAYRALEMRKRRRSSRKHPRLMRF